MLCQHLGIATNEFAELACCGGRLTLFECSIHKICLPFAYGRTARYLQEQGYRTCNTCQDKIDNEGLNSES